MSGPSLRFEVLSSAHDRFSFTCGVSALDVWFATRASQAQRRNVAQVFVAIEADRIVGFYSLSMFTLSMETLPPALAKKLPRYEAVPAALVGRLGRSTSVRGSGIGRLLVTDAIRCVLSVRQAVAAYAIVVDAKDESGKQFYESLGFIPLASRPRRLFLLTSTALAAYTAAK